MWSRASGFEQPTSWFRTACSDNNCILGQAFISADADAKDLRRSLQVRESEILVRIAGSERSYDVWGRFDPVA